MADKAEIVLAFKKNIPGDDELDDIKGKLESGLKISIKKSKIKGKTVVLGVVAKKDDPDDDSVEAIVKKNITDKKEFKGATVTML